MFLSFSFNFYDFDLISEERESVLVFVQLQSLLWFFSDFFCYSAFNTIYIWKLGLLCRWKKKDKIAPNGLWHKRAGLDLDPMTFLKKLINKNENYL